MTVRTDFFLAAVAALGAGLMLSMTAPASANDLEMFIENTTPSALYLQSDKEVTEAPPSIHPGTTSSEIKAVKKQNDEPVTGDVVYANSPNGVGATCSMTLTFDYVWNSVTDHCDSKTFTPTAIGSCQLRQEGDCYGSGSCKCNFVLLGQ